MNQSITNNSGEHGDDCEQARLQIGAEPRVVPAALAEHLRGCAPCSEYQRETLKLEHAIERALAVPVAAPSGVSKAQRLASANASENVVALPAPPSKQPRAPLARWALAASLVLAVTIGFLLWAARPNDALAADLVAHMAGETASWDRTAAVPESALALVLRKSGVALAPGAVVTYAHSCWFRGQFVPHLVVQSASGPVTVMILPGEQVATRERFNEVPYSGVIAPIDGGSVAVLTRGQGGDLDAVLDSVLAALKAPAAG